MKINQILWILSNETRNIIPALIVEKITKETSLGQKVEFIIEFSSGKRKNLSEIRDNYFESPEQARDHLMQTVTQMVDEIVNLAVSKSQTLANKITQVQDDSVHLDSEHDTMTDTISLPDGRVAKVNFKLPNS